MIKITHHTAIFDDCLCRQFYANYNINQHVLNNYNREINSNIMSNLLKFTKFRLINIDHRMLFILLCQNDKSIKYLIDCSLNGDISDYLKDYILCFLVSGNNNIIVEWFINKYHPDIDANFVGVNEPIISQCDYYNYNILKLLIDHDINLKYIDNITQKKVTVIHKVLKRYQIYFSNLSIKTEIYNMNMLI